MMQTAQPTQQMQRRSRCAAGGVPCFGPHLPAVAVAPLPVVHGHVRERDAGSREGWEHSSGPGRLVAACGR